MKNSQDIQEVLCELEEILKCDSLIYTNANDQQIWDVKGREIQLTVYAPDASDASFRVEIYVETDDPKEVIQAAKAFKSTYLRD